MGVGLVAMGRDHVAVDDHVELPVRSRREFEGADVFSHPAQGFSCHPGSTQGVASIPAVENLDFQFFSRCHLIPLLNLTLSIGPSHWNQMHHMKATRPCQSTGITARRRSFSAGVQRCREFLQSIPISWAAIWAAIDVGVVVSRKRQYLECFGLIGRFEQCPALSHWHHLVLSPVDNQQGCVDLADTRHGVVPAFEQPVERQKGKRHAGHVAHRRKW